MVMFKYRKEILFWLSVLLFSISVAGCEPHPDTNQGPFGLEGFLFMVGLGCIVRLIFIFTDTDMS